jgi:uncharacterized protein (TIGR02147 family)
MEFSNRETTYRQILKREFERRKNYNSSYSLRAYSRDLSISPQLLSYILKKKRKLPESYVDNMIEQLELNYSDELYFRQSVHNERNKLGQLDSILPSDQTIISDEEVHFNLISEWEYYAILTLLETSERFDSSSRIAEKLSLPIEWTEFIISGLEQLQLIKKSNGFYQLQCNELNTSWNVPSRALKLAHKNNLKLAKERLDTLPVEKRQFSSATLPIDSKSAEEAKKLIRDFQNKISALARTQPGESVYQLNIQFFSLTEPQTEEINNIAQK